MKAIKKSFCWIFIIVGLLLSGAVSSWAQLTLEWCQKTPEGENHTFREITINASSKKLYITDLTTDFASIYENNANGVVIGTFGSDVWPGSSIGPYGIDTAEDEQIYTALWDDRDLNGDGLPDHSLWRCTPSGKNLTRVCYLPDPPRGIQAHGAGANTTIYVSGTWGKIIRCSAETPFRFTSEILFETGIYMNQQDVLVDKSENRMYVSSFTNIWGWTPYDTPVTKWNMDGIRDESFSISYLTGGNVPALAFDASESFIYFLHNSVEECVTRIYKVDAMTGDEIDHVYVGVGGINGGGGIAVDRKGDIYFALALSRSFIGPSIWGKVVDHSLSKKMADNNTNLSEPEIATDYKLFQNSPNPFNPSTTIEYLLPKSSQVELKIYDVLGQEVQTLVNARQEPGRYQVHFERQGLPTGLYFYRLRAGEFYETNKMSIAK